MSSQHHGFLWPREANRTTLKNTPGPPRGGDLIFRAIWGIFSTLCIHGICIVRGLDGRNLESPQNSLKCPLPKPSWPLLPPGGAKCPSSELPVHYATVCHSLSTLHRSTCKRSVPPFPGECKPHRQGPGLIHFSVPGKYQRLKSSWKESSTIIMNPWLEHLLPVFRSSNGGPALSSKATLRV